MFDCRVDESQLTGEADDVLKDANEDALLLSGSKVLEGNGRALVFAVGSNSQAGIIANLARGPEDNPGLRCAYCPSVSHVNSCIAHLLSLGSLLAIACIGMTPADMMQPVCVLRPGLSHWFVLSTVCLCSPKAALALKIILVLVMSLMGHADSALTDALLKFELQERAFFFDFVEEPAC